MKVLKNILIGVSLLSATSLYAIGDCVVVDMINGDSYKFLFTENPILNFEDGVLDVSANSTLRVLVDDVEGISFPSNTTGLESVDNTAITLSVEDENLSIQNAEPNSKILLATINGMLIKESTTDAEGRATVKVPAKKDVYILSVGQKSIKFILK